MRNLIGKGLIIFILGLGPLGGAGWAQDIFKIPADEIATDITYTNKSGTQYFTPQMVIKIYHKNKVLAVFRSDGSLRMDEAITKYSQNLARASLERKMVQVDLSLLKPYSAQSVDAKAIVILDETVKEKDSEIAFIEDFSPASGEKCLSEKDQEVQQLLEQLMKIMGKK